MKPSVVLLDVSHCTPQLESLLLPLKAPLLLPLKAPLPLPLKAPESGTIPKLW